MTHTDYTRNILNIKDENIYFSENCLEFVNIKGINGHLPSILGIDEFKATTDTKSKMSFIIVD